MVFTQLLHKLIEYICVQWIIFLKCLENGGYIKIISYSCAVLLCHLAYYLYKERIKKYRDFNSLPGPTALPIVGSLHNIASNPVEILSNLNLWYDTYGGIFKLWDGPFNPTIVITDPEYVKTVLSSGHHLEKSADCKIFRSLLGDALFTNSGNRNWCKHRELQLPTFRHRVLEKYMESFHTRADTLIEKLGKRVDKDAFDIYHFISRYMLDGILETSFGIKLDIQNHPTHEYLHNLDKFRKLCTMRQYSFMGKMGCLFKFMGQQRKWYELITKLSKYSDETVSAKYWQRRAEKEREEEERDYEVKSKQSYLYVLLGLARQGHIDMEDIGEHLDTFTFTSHTTTTAALSFALFELAKHQDVQDKILDEISRNVNVMREDNFTIRDLHTLKYLECVCKEILRLYPAFPYVGRKLSRNIELGGKTIPKGTTATVFLYGIHRSEKYHQDPDIFDPDRFLPINFSKLEPFTYMPFSTGPRSCLGDKFALLIMKATIAKILRHFVIVPAQPEQKFHLMADPVLKSAYGVYVMFQSRI